MGDVRTGVIRALFPALLAVLLVTVALPGRADAAPVSAVPQQGWQVNGIVRATAVSGDTVFVGGEFTAALGPNGETVARNNLAAFSLSTGALLTSWRADTAGNNPAVYALETDGTSLWVGGGFTNVGGTYRAKLAKLSVATGALDAGFAPSPNGDVKALEYTGNSLYVGGAFSAIGGYAHTRVAKVAPATGTPDQGFDASTDGTVRALRRSPDGTRLYIAGNFGRVGGALRAGLGVVDATSGQLLPTVFPGSVQPMFDMDISDDGSQVFGAAGAKANSAVAWDAASGSKQWERVTMGDVQAIEHQGGLVYFGFHEGYEDDLSVRLLAADARSGRLDAAFRPDIDSFYGVWAIAAGPSWLVAGGEFTTVSGVAAQGFAIFRGSGSTPAPTPGQTYTETTVIPSGSEWQWRYQPGAPEPDWATTGSHPSSWKEGPAVLGFGRSTVTTNIDTFAQTADRPRTAYFTRTFTVGDPSTVSKLVLRSVADDGAVFYLNGRELVRVNMPSGDVTYLTYASVARSTPSANADPVVIDVPKAWLVKGANILAVETHLGYRATKDVSFDLRATLTTVS